MVTQTQPAHFRNWGGNQHSTPRKYCQPANEGEVVEIVRQAARDREGVRVVGAGHSWSPLVLTDQTMVNLDLLDQLAAVDAERMQVTVGAGIRLKQLNELLPRYGLALANLGSIAEQSFAGAMSTGTHGTGLGIGNLATQVLALRLVTGDGRVLDLNAERDPELMSAARVSLGALGIITQVTIQCVKAHNIRYHGELVPFDEVLDRLDQLNRENERVRLYWFSGSDMIYLMTMNPTEEPEMTRSALTAWYNDVFLRTNVLSALLKGGHAVPSMVESINRFQQAVGLHTEQHVARSDRALLIPITPPHLETEYAVAYERTAEALRRTRALIDAHHFKASFPVELRFVAGDQNMLSPAYGHAVCHVGAYTYGEDFAQPYFETFGKEMKQLGGRPHWGKWLELTAGEARQMYPQYDSFNAIRKDLDPAGIFRNDFLRELFPD